MKRLLAMCSTALFTGAMLVSSGGCSRDGLVPVLRGSEVVFRARRMSGSALPSTGSGPELAEGSLSKGRVILEVELAEGQEAEDVHREGWYVSSAQMSRVFELLEARGLGTGLGSGGTTH